MNQHLSVLAISMALTFLAPHNSLAQNQGKSEMNGIAFKTYDGFEKKWQLVTVRYRKDSSEQRFTWANAKAIKALEAGSTDYPDGSVFGKIGFVSEEDPLFRSSMVPSGSKRYQFMVRDKKKYAETGGWGYALFDGNKLTYEGDPKTQAMACYACHKLAESRGQVFSQPIVISAFQLRPTVKPDAADAPAVEGVTFATVPLKSIPEILQKSLPAVKQVRSVQGELRKHVFRGTIDEIRPTLTEEARKSGLPAALIEENGSQFAAVYPDKKRKDCPSEKSFKSVFSTQVAASGDQAPYLVVAWQDLCL